MFQFFHDSWRPNRPRPSDSAINLAVSATWRHGPGRLDWIEDQGLACAFTPDPERLDLISTRLAPYIHRGMAIRHHGYFPGKEIGHADPPAAEEAVQLHFRAMTAMRGVGEQLMTVHVGLDRTLPLDHDRVVKNLARLVRFGNRIGLVISLENMRRGPTSNPRTLLDWARRSGAGITLDIGHAVSSRCVRQNEISVVRIIELVSRRLMEVHLYESETDRHWAPKTMDILGPIVDKLVTTDCRWWTIELEALREVSGTRQLLADHFGKADEPFWRPETKESQNSALALENVH